MKGGMMPKANRSTVSSAKEGKELSGMLSGSRGYDHPSNEAILAGRIYPSMRSCVAYRYYLLIGLFLAFGLFCVNDNFFDIMQYGISKGVMILFWTLLSLHNYFNYFSLAKDQSLLEGGEFRWFKATKMEFWFGVGFIILNVIIWLALPGESESASTCV